ncbi:MAG TPA: cupin domain-containing protein [Bryobacteraceae bacterium]|nr:cupin domain-containing protein [Bryobacteraceae bacterium]
MPRKKKQSREGISRRNMFGAASLASLGAAATTSMWTRVAKAAPPPEHGKVEDIAEFKYDLEKQTHWVGPGGSAKEATVEEFPVSESMAGVSMRLDPGAIRELHWHALAAEWAYVLEGNVRTTVISPNGQAEVDDFGVGDTWYFPRGHGHALQGLGPGQAHFLLVFDNGHFSEFGTFGASDWISRTPPEILSRNLGLPASAFAGFPKKELYIGPGKVPPPLEEFINGDLQPSQGSHKYRLDRQPAKVMPGGKEHIVSSKEFPMQTTLTAVRMDLQPGALREMHWHPHADEWQYYAKGRGRVTVFGSHGRVKTEEFGPGQVCFVKQGYGHFIEQLGDEPTEILVLFNSGEYQEISLSNWLGANPVSILQSNFGMSKEMIDRLPRKETGIFGKRA